MSKLTVTTDTPMTKQELQEELVKAGKSIELPHERKELTEPYLRTHKNQVSKAVNLVFLSMINEINKVLGGK